MGSLTVVQRVYYLAELMGKRLDGQSVDRMAGKKALRMVDWKAGLSGKKRAATRGQQMVENSAVQMASCLVRRMEM